MNARWVIVAVVALGAGASARAPAEDAAGPPHVDRYGDALPDGAIARLGTVRYRHPGWNKRLEFLGDNRSVVVGNDQGGGLKVWDAATGELRHTFNFGGDQFRAFAVSGDKRRLATLSQRVDLKTRTTVTRITLFSADDFSEQSSIVDGGDLAAAPSHIALSPDGKSIATTPASRGKVKIWDADSGRVVATKAVTDSVNMLAFAPHGMQLVLTTRKGVLVWDVYSDQPPTVIKETVDADKVRFSPDGRQLVVSAMGHQSCLVDMAAQRIVRKLDAKVAWDWVDQLAFTPDGLEVVVPGPQDHDPNVFNAHDGQVIRSLTTGLRDAGSVVYSPDGEYMVATGSGAALVTWQRLGAGEYKRISDRFIGHRDSIERLAFLPDGERIVTCNMDSTIRIWNAATGEQVRLLRHDDWVTGLDVSPDGMRIVSASYDNTVRLWDADTGREIFRLPGHGDVGCHAIVAFAPDGDRFYSFGNDAYLRTYDATTGKLVEEREIVPEGREFPRGENDASGAGDPFGQNNGKTFAPTSASLFAGAGLLLVNDDNTRVDSAFELATGKQVANNGGLWLMTHDGAQRVSFTRPQPGQRDADGAPATATVKLLDGKTGQVIREGALPTEYARWGEFSHDDKLLACLVSDTSTGASRSRILIIDAATLNVVGVTGETALGGREMAWSPDGSKLAVGYMDSSALVWNVDIALAGAKPAR